MNPTVTAVVMGVSGVGKSTVALGLVARTGWVFAEGDDLHPPANRAKMAAGLPLDDADRLPWLRRIARWIGEQEAAGRDAVVTCSALRRAYRDVLREGHPSVRFIHLFAPTPLIGERVRTRRDHYMPPSLLDSQLAALEPLGPDEPGVVVETTGDVDTVVHRVLRAVGRPDVSGPGGPGGPP
ncbi:MAG TPA: gluconokinase [Pseudonocardia sp.]|nr:gluconokinase [Pseudonocardia sp.]